MKQFSFIFLALTALFAVQFTVVTAKSPEIVAEHRLLEECPNANFPTGTSPSNPQWVDYHTPMQFMWVGGIPDAAKSELYVMPAGSDNKAAFNAAFNVEVHNSLEITAVNGQFLGDGVGSFHYSLAQRGSQAPAGQAELLQSFAVFYDASGNSICRSSDWTLAVTQPQQPQQNNAGTESSTSEGTTAPTVVAVPSCTGGTVFILAGSPFVGAGTIVNSDDFVGTACDDIIHGNNNANTISGGGGNDTIFGYGDNDTLNGDAGNDTIHGGDESCTPTVGNRCDGANIGDTINGGEGDDTIHGGDENCGGSNIDNACDDGIHIGDTIDTGEGNDTVHGGNEQCNGNGQFSCETNIHVGDKITTGAGDDIVASGGDEQCNNNGFSSCDGTVHIGDDIDTGADNDTITAAGDEQCSNNDDASCDGSSQVGDKINTGAGNDTITSAGDEQCNNNGTASCQSSLHVGDEIDTGAGDDTVTSAGDEQCSGNGGASCSNNFRAGDVITDTAVNDTDTINADGGTDQVNISDGDNNDTVTDAEDVTRDAGDTEN